MEEEENSESSSSSDDTISNMKKKSTSTPTKSILNSRSCAGPKIPSILSLGESIDSVPISSLPAKCKWKFSESKKQATSASKSPRRAKHMLRHPHTNCDDEAGLRQGHVQMLRESCAQGALPHDQRRVLLTGITSYSAEGQNSMVEVTLDLSLVSPANAASTPASNSENKESEDNEYFAIDDDGEE